VTFDKVRVPLSNTLDKEGKGMSVILSEQDDSPVSESGREPTSQGDKSRSRTLTFRLPRTSPRSRTCTRSVHAYPVISTVITKYGRTVPGLNDANVSSRSHKYL
jgi:hypothetical protein